MLELLKQFVSIAFLTGKPYDLPAGRETLRFAVALALVTYVAAVFSAFGPGSALSHALLDLALSGAVLYVALMLAGKASRFGQAFAAICGAGAVINVASIPVIYTSVAGQASSVAEVVNFVFLVWGISVVAHVIRFSFETNIPISIVASFSYIMLAVTVFRWVFPA